MALMWITRGSGQELAAPVRQWFRENFKRSFWYRNSGETQVYQGKQFLLTCNGDWGVLSFARPRELVARGRRGSTGVEAWRSLSKSLASSPAGGSALGS